MSTMSHADRGGRWPGSAGSPCASRMPHAMLSREPPRTLYPGSLPNVEPYTLSQRTVVEPYTLSQRTVVEPYTLSQRTVVEPYTLSPRRYVRASKNRETIPCPSDAQRRNVWSKSHTRAVKAIQTMEMMPFPAARSLAPATNWGKGRR